MARISETFSGRWLGPHDLLPSKSLRGYIQEVTEEEIGQGKDKKIKLVVWIKGQEKGFVLNKTNGTVLADIYGDETDDWAGKRIVLAVQKVEYQGRTMDGIRINESALIAANSKDAPEAPSRSAASKRSGKPAPAMTQAEAAEGDDEDIPF